MLKKNKSIDILCEQFIEMFDHFNKNIFSEKLNPVEIVFNAKQKAAFKYDIKGRGLSIGSEIADLSLEEIRSTFLHEMIHCASDQYGMAESTPNQYHSKKYMQLATEAGFFVIRHKTQGWGITSLFYPRNVINKSFIQQPTKEAVAKRLKAFEYKLNAAVFKKAFQDIKNQISNQGPTKTFFLKYECQCPPPHNSIRSGRRPDGKNALNIICQYCNVPFRCVSKLNLE